MRYTAYLFLFAASVFGADLSGIWVGQLERPNNLPVDFAFQFKQSGNTLTGKLYGDYGSTPISETKIEGDTISFIVVTTEQAGNEILEVRLAFTGTINPNEIILNRERVSARNSANKGEGRIRPNANNQKQEIKLKRLL